MFIASAKLLLFMQLTLFFQKKHLLIRIITAPWKAKKIIDARIMELSSMLSPFFTATNKKSQATRNGLPDFLAVLELTPSGLLHNLNGALGAVGVGGHNDGQTVGLLHLLTSHVEVTYVRYGLACH